MLKNMNAMSPDKAGWGYMSLGLMGFEARVNEDGESVSWLYIGTQREQIHRKAKIYYTAKGRAYFMAYGIRRHLDQFLRYDTAI